MNILQQLQEPLEVKQEFDVLGFLIGPESNGVKLVRSEGDLEFCIGLIEPEVDNIVGEFKVKKMDAFCVALVSHMQIELKKQYDRTKSVILRLISEWENEPRCFVKSKKHEELFSNKKINFNDCSDLYATSFHCLTLCVSLGFDGQDIYVGGSNIMNIFEFHHNKLYFYSIKHYKDALGQLEKHYSAMCSQLHSKKTLTLIKRELQQGLFCEMNFAKADDLILFKNT